MAGIVVALVTTVLPVDASHVPATRGRCFGAASMDPRRPCHNPSLSLMVVPRPEVARHAANFPCTVVEPQDPLNVCAFGVSSARAGETIALLGDSHAGNWRAAVQWVAEANRWHALSLTLGGCPYSRSTRVLPEPLRTRCTERNQQVPGWFARHPEVHVVFVAQISGVRWIAPPGQSQFETEVDDYIAAWDALPASVRHIIVIRDTPKAPLGTPQCIDRAIARHRPAGVACRMPRRAVTDADAAAVAATRLRSRRVQLVDLSRYFCDLRWCYPVIGGALVQKDWNHLSSVFMASVGPYLQRQVSALMALWGRN
jgi:SGNH domain (fused to AT3 domains)